ncbi:hypothetical protein LSG31_20105 [Fodinisporobacter ferrooxydans]|uniref:Competence protein ComGF n=1 Tax=Fodinisporobacter ferrooxydans TaxID=2901836 RepID=A0ABY4CLT5_9BACL|nr:hypothetical protein LSG31_20105 [Alicyclobacillaceae bacterium MYW30-H2]
MRKRTDERGIFLWDLLVSVSISILLFSLILMFLSFVWHQYDRSTRQLDGMEQATVFFQQLREDVNQSTRIVTVGSYLQLDLAKGGTVELWFNKNPKAMHVVRLINGRGGEVACTNVRSVNFQRIEPNALRIQINLGDDKKPVHYDLTFYSKVI